MARYARGKTMETTYNKLVKIISEAIDSDVEVSRIQNDTNLFEDLEIDSISILEIVCRIEEEWNISLTDYPQLLDEIETVGSLVSFLENDIGVNKYE